MSQEQENFYRHSTVIIDETKDSFLHLLDFYLTNQGITFQRFIEIHGHKIYHLCYYRYACCQCPPNSPNIRGSRVLHPPQLDILFNPAGGKLLGHNPRSMSAPHCCCPVKPNLKLHDLDFSLGRILLVNFTTLVPPGSVERNALESLATSRNDSFAHAKEGKISNNEYQRSMIDIEKSLLVLAKVYGRETETKQRLRDIAKQPLNTAICLQFQNTLLQQCRLEDKIDQLLAGKTLPNCLTKDLCDVIVTEGSDGHFEIWTKDEEQCVLWSKDGMDLVNSKQHLIGKCGKIHSLHIKNTCMCDKGRYTVRVNDIERHACLDVKEYFTKNIQSVECIEGEIAEFTCEVIEDNIPARWSKQGSNLKHEGKYEIMQFGKTHQLSITNCDLNDAGEYTVNINNRVRTTSLSVREYFTNNLQNVECIEGETAEFKCEVIEDNIPARWCKQGSNLKHEGKYEIMQFGKTHQLSITNCELNDAGEYTVNINNRVRTTSLSVRDYFTSTMERNIQCIEGDKVDLIFEVLEANVSAVWEKDGVVLHHSLKYGIKDIGKTHILSIAETDLHDAGNYTVLIANRKRLTSLKVEAIPVAFRQMSEEDKSLYLEIIQSATETRYYIRIMIIGENGVGKTCLLRRLLGESIDDVESTDGIDIVHRCKIRLHDGQWIISEETNKKKDLITRIKMVVNAKASDDVNMEYKESSQSSITQLPQNSQKWPGTSKEVRPTVINRKSLEDKLESTEPILPNTDDKGRGNNDESVLTRVESKRSLSQSKMFKITEQKIKPTLEKVLTESILNKLSQFINDIDKFDIPNEIFVDCGFWDFAGQRYYYPTHQIFLNRNAVHLLVADIMKDLKRISTEVAYDKIGEYIDFWFDSIHSCGAVEAMNDSPGDHLNPSVIVVCTGIDKCQDKLDERKNEFRKQIMSLLGEEEKQKHLRRICCLSNTEPSDKDFDYLRQSIFEFGKKIETFGEKLPLRWIRLEKTLDILYEAGINILSWPDMADLASKCSIDDDNEVSLFLKYHHKIGTIIYFESVKEFIILNQKWLADAFRCFVSDKYDNDLKLTPEWKTLEDTGELKPTLIKKLFQKETKHEFCRHEDHLLKVMEMFGVIVRVTALNEYGQKQSLPIFYMPCMISDKTSIGQIYDMFGVKRDTCKQTPWLCIQFEFMPFDFFNHIFCHYIRQYPVCVEAKTRRMTIYHGMGVFVLDKSRKFVLCFSKNVIALQIWQWKKLEKGNCKAMLKELRSVISNVKNKYEPRKVMYTVKTKCANGNIHDAVGRLSYTELVNEVEEGDEGYLCGEHHEFHDTRDLFETWFEDYSECRQVVAQVTNLQVKAAIYGLVGVAGLPIEIDRASEPSARDISGKQMETGLVGVADVPVEADRDSKPSTPDPYVDPGSQQETNEVCEPESRKSEDFLDLNKYDIEDLPDEERLSVFRQVDKIFHQADALERRLQLSIAGKGVCSYPHQLEYALRDSLLLHPENTNDIESLEKRLKENCCAMGLRFKGSTPRNGNCFFEAISSQLNSVGLEDKSPNQLRQEVVEYLEHNKVFQGNDGPVNIEQFVSGAFQNWCAEMKQNGVFADHVTVLGMAQFLQTDIMIVTSSPRGGVEHNVTWIIGKEGFSGSPILLGHYWENHYQSLEPKLDNIQVQTEYDNAFDDANNATEDGVSVAEDKGIDPAISSIDLHATFSQPLSAIPSFSDGIDVIYTRDSKEQSKKLKQGIQDSRFKQNCHVCDKKPSVYLCHDCQKSMCNDCNNQHRKSKDTSLHIVHVQHEQDTHSLNYSFKVNVGWIGDIKVLLDGLLVISDYKGKRLVTCHISGQQEQAIPLSGGPNCIAVVDNNTVAVTLSFKSYTPVQSIYTSVLQSLLSTSFTATYPTTIAIVNVRQGLVEGSFGLKVQCSGIMYRDSQLFLGCDDKTIKVMNMSGDVTRTIPVGVVPHDICGGETGWINFTGVNVLYCISTEGDTLFTYTDPDTSDSLGITTDDEGHVLVICAQSNSVCRISPESKQSQVIISQIPLLIMFPTVCYYSLWKSVVIGINDTVFVYKKV